MNKNKIELLINNIFNTITADKMSAYNTKVDSLIGKLSLNTTIDYYCPLCEMKLTSHQNYINHIRANSIHIENYDKYITEKDRDISYLQSSIEIMEAKIKLVQTEKNRLKQFSPDHFDN